MQTTWVENLWVFWPIPSLSLGAQEGLRSQNYHTDIPYIIYVPFNKRPSKTSTFIRVSGPNCHKDIPYSGPKRLSYRPIVYLICLFQHRLCCTNILLPEEVFQQFLLFIILPKVVHSSYFQKKSFNNSYFILLPKEVYSSYFRRKSFNNSYHSSYFRKKSIHLTSERSLSTILILHQTSERGKFILLTKQVFQQFLLHLTILTSTYFRKKSIHLTSERGLSTFLIICLISERSTFILLPKEVFQQFLLFLLILQVNFTI